MKTQRPTLESWEFLYYLGTMINYLIAQFQTLLRVKETPVNICKKTTNMILDKLGYMVNLPLSNAFGGSKDTH